MIQIYRTGSKVQIHVQHGIFHNNSGFELDINQAHEYNAELLTRALQENLNNHLVALKKKYYEEGWKNAKAKKQKRTHFWGGWEK